MNFLESKNWGYFTLNVIRLISLVSRYRYSTDKVTHRPSPPPLPQRASLGDSLSVLKFIRTSLMVRITMSTCTDKVIVPITRPSPCTDRQAASLSVRTCNETLDVSLSGWSFGLLLDRKDAEYFIYILLAQRFISQGNKIVHQNGYKKSYLRLTISEMLTTWKQKRRKAIFSCLIT